MNFYIENILADTVSPQITEMQSEMPTMRAL